MPELPEVEVIVKGLKNNILNLKISDLKIINKNLRYPIPNNLETLCKNKKIKNVLRRGKYGIILLNGDEHIVFHLGMTGKFRFSNKLIEKYKHDHILIKFSNGINLIYNDVRKFGSFSIIKNPIDLYNFKNLGIEPFFLEYVEDNLWKKLKQKGKDIKSILLDQCFISGIGNIYASEILFDSNIYPFKEGKKLSKKSFSLLLKSTEKILRKAISKGGVTIKDYRNVTGDLGYFKINLKVYGREGLSCNKCKSLIVKVKRGGRSTFYCESCQKK